MLRREVDRVGTFDDWADRGVKEVRRDYPERSDLTLVVVVGRDPP